MLVLLSLQRARTLAEAGLVKAAVRHTIWSHARHPAHEFRGDVYGKALTEPKLRLNDKRRGVACESPAAADHAPPGSPKPQ